MWLVEVDTGTSFPNKLQSKVKRNKSKAIPDYLGHFIETYSVIWQKYYTQGFQNRFMSFTCLYCICYAAFKMYPFHLKTTRGYFSDIVTKQTCCTHQPELLVQAIYLFRIIAGSPKQATQEITLLTQWSSWNRHMEYVSCHLLTDPAHTVHCTTSYYIKTLKCRLP